MNQDNKMHLVSQVCKLVHTIVFKHLGEASVTDGGKIEILFQIFK